jgi:hypothetical protein
VKVNPNVCIQCSSWTGRRRPGQFIESKIAILVSRELAGIDHRMEKRLIKPSQSALVFRPNQFGGSHIIACDARSTTGLDQGFHLFLVEQPLQWVFRFYLGQPTIEE